MPAKTAGLYKVKMRTMKKAKAAKGKRAKFGDLFEKSKPKKRGY